MRFETGFLLVMISVFALRANSYISKRIVTCISQNIPFFRRSLSVCFEACNSYEETQFYLKNRHEIKAQITSIGPLGASVDILHNKEVNEEEGNAMEESKQIHGLISMTELKLHREILRQNSQSNIYIGDILPAYVHHIREDGKVDVGLRPKGRERVNIAKDIILAALVENNTLPIGDKSDPKLIRKFFPGISKLQFKNAIGSLFKEGVIIPSKESVRFIPEDERNPSSSSSSPSSLSTTTRSKENLSATSSDKPISPRHQMIKKKNVPLGIDSVYITKLSYKTKEAQLIHFIENSVPNTKVLEVKDFYGEDGRPSGKAVVKLAVKQSVRKYAKEKKIKEVETLSTLSHVKSSQDLTAKTVKELKELLKLQGLPVSGLKNDLISRILAHDDNINGEEEAEDDDDDENGVEDEDEIAIEHLVSDLCEFDGSQLHHRVINIRPYFPPRSSSSSTTPPPPLKKLKESTKTSDIEAGLNNKQQKIRQEKKFLIDDSFLSPPGTVPVVKDVIKDKFHESISIGIGDGNDDFDSLFQSNDDDLKHSNQISSSTSSTKPMSSNDYRKARMAGKLKRGGNKHHVRITKDDDDKEVFQKRILRAISSTKKNKHHYKNHPCVFFGNLPYNFPQADLAEEIEAVAGEGCIVEMRPSPYGDYCHVDFTSREHALVAIRELNKYQLNHRTLKVDFASGHGGE